MKVLVNGIGNIGTTILHLLVQYKKEFGISEIYAHKNTIKPWQSIELENLRKLGIILTSSAEQEGFISFQKALSQVSYVFECGANGSGMRNKPLYEQHSNIVGVAAQGSEKGFGLSYMSGVTDQLVPSHKYIHVVSCNTHGTAALLTTFGGTSLENLVHADCVVVRRSEDLGNHDRLVSANVVARHLDPLIGTHHAIDVTDMFKSIGIQCNLTSSDITTPSQLMHAVRFNVTIKNSYTQDQLMKLVTNNHYLAVTSKFDSNVIFEQGRRYGFHGRIYAHAILVSSNLLIHENNIKGWAFVPQEGNSILSTLHAFLLKMQPALSDNLMAKLKADLLRNIW